MDSSRVVQGLRARWQHRAFLLASHQGKKDARLLYGNRAKEVESLNPATLLSFFAGVKIRVSLAAYENPWKVHL
jgi:hypothetical protein